MYPQYPYPPAPQPVFFNPNPPAQQAQSRPWVTWGLMTAFAFFIAYQTGTLPKIPPLPISPPAPLAPRAEPPARPPVQPPAVEPTAAIARITFGRSGCTAAPIAPRRADGRYWVLTAAHCVDAVGQRGSMRFRDGRSVGVQVAALNKAADACWLITDTNDVELPTLKLADTQPQPGTPVWHAGFGVDRPGNREEGVSIAETASGGKVGFTLNVSSGDSGGPILTAAGNEVVSCVCCTTARGARVTMFGASLERIRALRPDAVNAEEWTPTQIPECSPEARS